MGSKFAKKATVNPKRAAPVAARPKASKAEKKAPKQKEEELQLPSESESDSEDEEFEGEASGSESGSDSEEEEEEQLGGFESTDDEDEDSDDESDEEEHDEEAVKESKEKTQTKAKKVETHEVKNLPQQTKKQTSKKEKAKKGVIYIGRLPEGFEESELQKYFDQFGDITNVKVPRNKKTGRSKHYAFVEFSNADDANVAQETMNNYLLLNHQLKVNIVDEEFKATKKFKKAFFKVSKPKRDVKTLNENAQKKSQDRKKALKAAGIDF